ncbi:MAG: hypothetical protein IJY61_01590 [Candidatus Gastranaerophilales bacterium]|nr:hypothetical protein [Candidatus Gastranaerophilales bacterium]
MKTPIDLAKKYIFIPANRINKKIQSINIFKFFNKAADVVFEYSKETALIMLLGDAISIFSSHTEQIKGLKKSDRENKDLLIDQERIERTIDLVLNIIPPFALTRFLKKQLESGQVTTRRWEHILQKIVGPGVGAHIDELKSINYIRPVKETIIGGTSKVIQKISENPKLKPEVQEFIANTAKNLIQKIPDLKNMYITKSKEEIASFYDDMGDNVSSTIRNMLRNGSAYDEIQGMVNGLCIAGVIGYSILASNVVMPILKNKISKYKTEKDLAKKGETRESIKRKKRFAYTQLEPVSKKSQVFDTFDTPYQYKEKNIFSEEKIKTPEKQIKRTSNTFETFEKYNQHASHPTGLRI